MLFFSAQVCYPIPVPKVYQLAKHISGKDVYQTRAKKRETIKAGTNSPGLLPIVVYFNFNLEDVANVGEFVPVLR